MSFVVTCLALALSIWAGMTSRAWPAAVACAVTVCNAAVATVTDSGWVVAWNLLVAVAWFAVYMHKAWPRAPHEASARERLRPHG